MQGRTLILFLISLAGLSGCTPLGESVLRKADGGASDVVQSPLPVPLVAPPESLVDRATEDFLRRHGSTIKQYARRYGLDWRLVLATVKQESRFLPDAESHKGAYGLMQLMPHTGEELARVLEVEDITRPSNNMRAGMYYMRQLFDLFEGAEEGDRIRLTLAAYNAGIGRIYDAQELAAYLHENPLEWESVRDALPFLSRRYQSLHRSIWAGEKPRAGFFGNAEQTLRYVDNVMAYYDDYRLMFN